MAVSGVQQALSPDRSNTPGLLGSGDVRGPPDRPPCPDWGTAHRDGSEVRARGRRPAASWTDAPAP